MVAIAKRSVKSTVKDKAVDAKALAEAKARQERGLQPGGIHEKRARKQAAIQAALAAMQAGGSPSNKTLEAMLWVQEQEKRLDHTPRQRAARKWMEDSPGAFLNRSDQLKEEEAARNAPKEEAAKRTPAYLSERAWKATCSMLERWRDRDEQAIPGFEEHGDKAVSQLLDGKS